MIEYMKMALEEANIARDIDEVPVGAVVVREGEVISRGHNMRQCTHDATQHAEMIAIREACEVVGDWRLEECDIYVTLEPCPMCMGAILNSRLRRVVYGAYDGRYGACGSHYDLRRGYNHTPEVIGGVYNEKCSEILTEYFKEKRGE